jgi:hypothetical protein
VEAVLAAMRAHAADAAVQQYGSNFLRDISVCEPGQAASAAIDALLRLGLEDDSARALDVLDRLMRTDKQRAVRAGVYTATVLHGGRRCDNCQHHVHEAPAEVHALMHHMHSERCLPNLVDADARDLVLQALNGQPALRACMLKALSRVTERAAVPADKACDPLANRIGPIAAFHLDARFADFHVNGIPCHRVVLAATSGFFDLMFGESFRQCDAYQPPDDSADAAHVDDMLAFMYTGQLSVNGGKCTARTAIPQLLSLALAADYWDVRGMVAACARELGQRRLLDAWSLLAPVVAMEEQPLDAWAVPLRDAVRRMARRDLPRERDAVCAHMGSDVALRAFVADAFVGSDKVDG